MWSQLSLALKTQKQALQVDSLTLLQAAEVSPISKDEA